MTPRIRWILYATAVLVALGLFATSAFAQKGTGDSTGVAASGDRPALITLSGTVTAVKEGPCTSTTGRSPMGTHLLLDTEDGPVNLHLGPTAEVTGLRAAVDVGSDVTAEAFRTDALPDGAYVAVTVTTGDTTHRLRDATTLRPEWARGEGRGGPRGRGDRYNGGRCW